MSARSLCVTFIAAVCAALVLPAAGIVRAQSPEGTLEGAWRLIEQRYGEGQYNFVNQNDDLRTEFRLESGALRGTVTWDGGRAAWPAYPAPGGAAPSVVIERSATQDLRGAAARYRVQSGADGETELQLEERWELLSYDRARCTVEIRFFREGRSHGGFTWHRVYAREAGQ
jgi:hypothetical protein